MPGGTDHIKMRQKPPYSMIPSGTRLLRRAVPAILLGFSLVSGCADAAPPTLEPVVQDSSGVLIQEFPEGVLERPAGLQLADTPTVRIGVVDGAAEYQWTRPVAAARLSNGGFAVAEQVPAEVRVFDSSGAFVRRVGSAGDGPGEFRTPVGVGVLPGDTILVWDRGAQRLSWFSNEGTLARERTLREPGGIRSLRRVVLSPGGAVVVLGATTTEEDLGNQGRVREIWQVVPLAPGGSPDTSTLAEPSIGTVPGTERAIQIQRSDAGEVMSVNVQGRWWWGEGFAWASEQGVWTADRLAFEARHFDLDRGLDRIVRVSVPDRPFTPALIDSLHGVELDREDDPVIRDLWRADFEGREYPQAVPPVAGVFADGAGRVWIGRTAPPPERLPSGEWPAIRRWVVFESDAASEAGDPRALVALGVVELPPRSHPLWADREGVLLVRNDAEFDVSYVEWYPYAEM